MPVVTQTVIRQAAANLLDLYPVAIRGEDIDRLQVLLHEASEPQTDANGLTLSGEQMVPFTRADSLTFRKQVASDFRQLTVTDHHVSVTQRDLDDIDHLNVAFRETLSFVAPEMPPTQQTVVFDTTFQLALEAPQGEGRIGIEAVERLGPLYHVTMHGRVLGDIPTRVDVTGMSPISGVEGKMLASSSASPQADCQESSWPWGVAGVDSGRRHFRGIITPESGPERQTLCVRSRSDNADPYIFAHRYRLRNVTEHVIQRVSLSRGDTAA